MKQKPTILAVDDTELNLDIMVHILKNYDVIPSVSGEDALQILAEEDVDLILLDVVMPDMDGFEICKKIKQNPKTKAIPIIFVTVKNSEQDIKQCFEFGGVDYVSKPFNAIELLSRVQTHLALIACRVNVCKKLEKMEPDRDRLIGVLQNISNAISNLSDLNTTGLKTANKNDNNVDHSRDIKLIFSKSKKLINSMKEKINIELNAG
ncbi:response regulator [Desulfobacula phenolica]|uniref:Response regulator receiver domain-containing protein n=1 Tax=Desulfobacula phenolica TaxID=90732 RepID=A0A1H2DNS1_9BACT|nr:response regulator [Desulfobacula phenolica]SDT84381.1 Response regulator receiver domain-containing protein [Desulfobacula phenolica]